MENDIWLMIIGLATATFTIRLSGYLVALHLPKEGAWAKGMEALPGCLIVALVALMILKGGPVEWLGGALVLAVAAKTRNLPISMVTGIAVVAGLRLLG